MSRVLFTLFGVLISLWVTATASQQSPVLDFSLDTDTWNCQPRNPSLLIFNRVPKCGTTSFQQVLKKLWNRQWTAQTKLGVAHTAEMKVESVDLADMEWDEETQLSVMTGLKDAARRRGVFYNHHMYWVDTDALFAKHGVFVSNVSLSANGAWDEHKNPFVDWINILRDPIDRTISLFYYRKDQGSPTLQNVTLEEALDTGLLDYHRSKLPMFAQYYCNYYTRWFCGNDPSCRGGDKNALAKAMHVLRTQYALVGTTESMSEMLWALQKLYPSWLGELEAPGERAIIPHMNAGKTRKRRHTSQKPPLSQETLEKIRKLNENDILLYNWVKEYFGARIRACLD